MTRQDFVRHDYYEILNLSFTETSNPLSKQQIKIAYHKALLKHHPDKAGAVASDLKPTTTASTISSSDTPCTIDEITTAYKTLSDPYLRAEYDRVLRLDRVKVAQREKTGDVFHTGLEIVDLEDLTYEEGEADTCADESETGSVWYRSCRCGDERGFLVTENDLEREAEHGEIVVGCRGCSLWMKVLFAVEDEGNADNEQGGGKT